MKKKLILLELTTVVAVGAVYAVSAFSSKKLAKGETTKVYNHYAQVDPGWSKGGIREYWISCDDHTPLYEEPTDGTIVDKTLTADEQAEILSLYDGRYLGPYQSGESTPLAVTTGYDTEDDQLADLGEGGHWTTNNLSNTGILAMPGAASYMTQNSQGKSVFQYIAKNNAWLSMRCYSWNWHSSATVATATYTFKNDELRSINKLNQYINIPAQETSYARKLDIIGTRTNGVEVLVTSRTITQTESVSGYADNLNISLATGLETFRSITYKVYYEEEVALVAQTGGTVCIKNIKGWKI